MDLIYTNAKREDEGVLHDYAFDLAFGDDENNFELTVDSTKHCCVANSIVYIEGTEYGGVVDGIKAITKDNSIVYNGRTWHGILEARIIEPDVGADYLTVSGEANTVISTLIDRLDLADLFKVSTDNSGLRISDYSFNRYIDAYKGIGKMLTTVNGKLHFSINHEGKVILSAKPIVDYSADEQFDSDQVEMKIEKTYNAVNHLICLGKGDLAQRQVIHLYSDNNGNISGNKTFTGIHEITVTYDYSNVESLDELRKGGIDKLKEYNSTDSCELNFNAEQTIYDIGDIIGAKEVRTGIFSKGKITKKIVNISKGQVNIEYKVGDAN